MVWLWGWHVFYSVLKYKKRKVYSVHIVQKFYNKIKEIVPKNVEIHIQNEHFMNKTYGKNHQGIAFCVDQIPFWSLKQWINDFETLEKSVLVACDLLEDPQNLGSIIRTAKALGANGLLVTNRKCAPFNGALAKAASGALEILPIIKVVNLSQSLTILKDFGYRIYGLDHRGNAKFTKMNKSVIVLGQEGEGLRELTKKKCDDIIAIHTNQDFAVLNVSVSAGIILYELLK